MLKIVIPNNNINERQYIIDIIFREYLNIEFYQEIGTSNYEVVLENNHKLIIEDHFFNKYPIDLDYLNIVNLPIKVIYSENNFIIEKDIPIIFGNSKLIINNSELIICGIDIFASTFFMLSRWEEYVNPNRDNHNRFPSIESIASKNRFLDRAVVNEYIEMLWNMLLHLGFEKNRTYKKNQLFITHDIDRLYKWKNWQQVIRVTIGDLLKRKSYSLASERIAEYYKIKRNIINDPFNIFDWLIDKSDKIGIKSRFYFMSGGITKYDNRYKIDEAKSIDLINKINQRGHIIGLHSSYCANIKLEQFQREKKLLEEVTGLKITEGRNHYLRFEVPGTWQIWEDADMEIDSTCGYADKEGFRCGTGDEFSVFNILTRKKLKLKERPLLLMDSCLCSYEILDLNKIKEVVKKLMKNTHTFTILWHNSQIKRINIYEKLLTSVVK